MQDSYGNEESNVSELLKEIEEQRKIIEQQQLVLDIIKDWDYSEQKASKARMAIQALIKGML